MNLFLTKKLKNMKRLIRVLTVAVLAFSIIAASCTKSNNSVTNDTPIATVITQGSWFVHYYFDNGSDETSDYAAYSFTFNASGSVLATKSGVTITGSWTELSDDGLTKMQISFPVTDIKLNKLNDKWVISSKTNDLIQLKDDNPSKNEALHFKKQ
jgi:hypothetical protein